MSTGSEVKWIACEQPERPIIQGVTKLHRPPCRGCAVAYAAFARQVDYDLDHPAVAAAGGTPRPYTRREYIEMGLGFVPHTGRHDG